MTIIDICNGLSEYPSSDECENDRRAERSYDGTSESFQSASEYIRKLQMRRFTGDNNFQMQIDHFWPLPFCSGESDVYHQSQSFTQ